MKADTYTSRGEGRLEKRVVSAGLWATLQNFIREGAGFLVFIVLARFFLTDEDFGIISFSLALIMVASTLGQAGLNVLIIQMKEITLQQLSASFWFYVAISILLFALLSAISPLIEILGGSPKIPQVLQVLSIGIPITFMGLVHEAILQRKMQFKPLAIRRLIAVLISGICAILTAYFEGGVWSLVVLNLVNSTVSTIMLWLFVRWRPLFLNPIPELRQLLLPGFSITSLGFIRFIGDLLDKSIIGLSAGVNQLGLYYVSEKMVRSLHLVLTQSINAVAMPAFSETQSDTERTKKAFLNSLTLCFALTTPVFLGVAAVSEKLTVFLLGNRWQESGDILLLLTIASSLSPALFFVDPILIAIGKRITAIKTTLAYQVIGLCCVFVGSFWGIFGVCIGIIARQLVGNFILVVVMKDAIGLTVGEFFRAIWRPYLSGFSMMILITLFSGILYDSFSLGLLILIGVFSYPIFLSVLDRETTKSLINIIRKNPRLIK